MTDLFSVENKIVLVCGGSRGIGLAIAQAFHERGARAIVAARHEESLRQTGLPFLVCDVAQTQSIERCVEDVLQKNGGVDVLFNVAGINFRHAAETFPESEFDRVMAINVRGNYLMASRCGRAMVSQGHGKIVNIASLHTHMSLPGVSAYGMSKGSIASFTRALAVEWAPHNIQVNAIAPGFIRTDLNKALWEKPAMREWVESRTPAGRLGQPADLVGTALFLATPASDFMTGQILYVDGGLTAGSPWPIEFPR